MPCLSLLLILRAVVEGHFRGARCLLCVPACHTTDNRINSAIWVGGKKKETLHLNDVPEPKIEEGGRREALTDKDKKGEEEEDC